MASRHGRNLEEGVLIATIKDGGGLAVSTAADRTVLRGLGGSGISRRRHVARRCPLDSAIAAPRVRRRRRWQGRHSRTTRRRRAELAAPSLHRSCRSRPGRLDLVAHAGAASPDAQSFGYLGIGRKRRRPCHSTATIPDSHRAKLDNGFLVAPGYKRTRQGKQVLELRFDDIAGCLRTPEGGSSRQFLVIKKSGKLLTRVLTARETARLMGAPDTYKLPGSYNDAYRAMGDAVAVPPARWLAKHLLFPLSEALNDDDR